MTTKKKAQPKKATTKRAPRRKAAPRKAAKPEHPLMENAQSWNREKVCDFVFEILASSSKGLGQILAGGYPVGTTTHALPSYSTLMKWLSEDKALSERYTRAHEAKAEYLAHEILEITDNVGAPLVLEGVAATDERGRPIMVVSHEAIAHAKLRADKRQWLMSKLLPKKYGEATLLKHAGHDGQAAPTLILNMGGAPASTEGEE